MARSKKKATAKKAKPKMPEGNVPWYVWNKYLHAVEPLMTMASKPINKRD